MTGPHYEESEPRWFGVKRARLKWILLAVLVVDAVVVGSLVAANMASGAKPMPAGPATPMTHPCPPTDRSNIPVTVCSSTSRPTKVGCPGPVDS